MESILYSQVRSGITSFIYPECKLHFEFVEVFRPDAREVDSVHCALRT